MGAGYKSPITGWAGSLAVPPPTTGFYTVAPWLGIQSQPPTTGFSAGLAFLGMGVLLPTVGYIQMLSPWSGALRGTKQLDVMGGFINIEYGRPSLGRPRNF
jgi:hypothetical protein